MKQYLSISPKPAYSHYSYLFDKIDGSNIRAEWDRKKGFWKYGSRRRLIGSDQEYLSEAEGLIRIKYEENISRVFEKQKYQKVIAFFEFYGSNNFAGFHVDELHDVILIDVNPYKSGITNPDEFIDLYGDLGIPDLIFKGNFNHLLEEQIRKEELVGITFEGVVGKIKTPRKQSNPGMFKVKTYRWLKRLKKLCEENKNLNYNELL